MKLLEKRAEPTRYCRGDRRSLLRSAASVPQTALGREVLIFKAPLVSMNPGFVICSTKKSTEATCALHR